MRIPSGRAWIAGAGRLGAVFALLALLAPSGFT